MIGQGTGAFPLHWFDLYPTQHPQEEEEDENDYPQPIMPWHEAYSVYEKHQH
jgi:hypothetical protein